MFYLMMMGAPEGCLDEIAPNKLFSTINLAMIIR